MISEVLTMDIVLCTREEAENYLAHYGVPGMKRNIRRWQNEDGTYTNAGKIHYGIGDGRQAAAKQEPKRKFTFGAASKPVSSGNGQRKFTFSSGNQASPQPETRSNQNGRHFPAQGRKVNVTGVAKQVTTGAAVSTNGPVSGRENDSVQYEAYRNYLLQLLPVAINAKNNGADLSNLEEPVDSIPGKLAKEYLLKTGILPKDVVGLFHDEMLQFFYNRWMANPNSKFSEFVNETMAKNNKSK